MHLEPGAFPHHRDQVLADVVDVALDGADHGDADLRHAGLRQQRAQDLHGSLHRIGGAQHLGHEEDARAEVLPNDIHAGHQAMGQDVGGGLPPRQRLIRGCDDLGANPS